MLDSVVAGLSSVGAGLSVDGMARVKSMQRARNGKHLVQAQPREAKGQRCPNTLTANELDPLWGLGVFVQCDDG